MRKFTYLTLAACLFGAAIGKPVTMEKTEEIFAETAANLAVISAGELNLTTNTTHSLSDDTNDESSLSNASSAITETDGATEMAQETGSPAIYITEIGADPIPMEFASEDASTPDRLVRSTDDIFEYVELHNYGTAPFDLKNCVLKITNNSKTYRNAFLFETESGGVIGAGETFILFNFNTSSYSYTVRENGVDVPHAYLNYDTSENLANAWAEFEKFYGIEIPETNRGMSLACDTSGNEILGSAKLPNGGDNKLEIVNSESGEAEACAKYAITTQSLSQNYTAGENGESKFLCVNGATPYCLLPEQDDAYTPSFDFSGEKVKYINYNVLYSGYEFASRAACFADFLDTYSPDVLALQEVGAEWYEYLHKVLPAYGYSYIEVIGQTGGTKPTYNGDMSNPIIYKETKYTEEKHGTYYVTEDGTLTGAKWDSKNRLRTVNYAVLVSKASGKKFNVVTTHGILTGDEAKYKHGDIFANAAAKLREENGGASILSGDMNFCEGSGYYQNILKSGEFKNAKYAAKTRSYRVTWANFGRCQYGATDKAKPWEIEAQMIDFIFVSKGVQVKNYRVIDQEYYGQTYAEKYTDRALRISDHAAVFAEIYI